MALTKEQIKQLWIQQGGEPKYAEVMSRIAMRESRGNPNAQNLTYPDHSIGLFQINQLAHKGAYGTDRQLMNPVTNIKAAIALMKASRAAGQDPLKPWSTYNPATDIKLIGNNTVGGARSTTTGSTTKKTVTKTKPAIDRSALRTQLIAQFVSQGGTDNPNAVLGLASGLSGAKDTPARKVKKTVTVPGKPVSFSGSSNPKAKGPLYELFWQGAGGIDVDNGKIVPQGFVSGHTDHVHVAAPPKTVVKLGKLAQRMGLHVGENPHFGGVNPVHVNGSFHYKNEAIDVSGDPGLMRRYAHRVARLYGL